MNSTISTQQLTRTEQGWVCEISDLGRAFQFCQIYPDSCDEGLRLVSHKSGQQIDMVVHTIRRTEDGIISWELVTTAKSARQFPRTRGLILTIFND